MGIFTLTFDILGLFSGSAPVLQVIFGGNKVSQGRVSTDGSSLSIDIDTGTDSFDHSLLRFVSSRFQGNAADKVIISNIRVDGNPLATSDFTGTRGGSSDADQITLTQGSIATFDAQAEIPVIAPPPPPVTLATITGTNGADRNLFGTANADTIDGLDGNDRIRAQDGDDLVNGGDGDDNIAGQDGNDILNGDGGDDTIFGNAGNDTINGGAGNDRLSGNEGNDFLFGNDGNDRINGNDGADQISGGAGNDRLSGDDGNDILNGDDGEDQLFGGDGDDTLNGGNGNDRILGNNGNDTLNGDGGDDNIDGQLGNDIINGGDGNDTLDGEQGDDIIDGGAGDDYVIGGQGADTLTGGDGNDTLYGGGISSFDQFTIRENSSFGRSNLFFNEQTQSFYTYVTTAATVTNAIAIAENTFVEGVGGHIVNITSDVENDFIDRITGSDRSWIGATDSGEEGQWEWLGGVEAGTVFYTGNVGGSAVGGSFENWSNNEPNDFNTGEDFAELRDGGNWNDFGGPAFSNSSLRFVIEWNADEILADNSIDILNGGAGNDTLYGGAGNDTLNGDADDDILYGQEGNDILNGGTGNDIIVGGTGNDILNGGTGNDILYGNAGSNTLNGGDGDDTAVLDGNRSDFTITLSNSIFTIVDTRVSNNINTAVNVENFSFDDGDLLADELIDNSADIINGTSGNDTLISTSIPVGSNQFIIDILTNNPQPVDGRNGTQDLVYNPDTGNFYQYVLEFTNATNINNLISNGTLNGVRGNLVTFESEAELNFVLNNLGADFGNSPSFVNGTIVGDRDISNAIVTNSPLTTLNSDGTFGSSTGFRPFIVEFDGDAVLGENSNAPVEGQSATLIGGAGNDDLFGADGLDIFIFENATAFGAENRDTIFDFDISDGDKLDISDILSGQGINVTQANIDNFVRIDEFNGLRIDTSGNGQFFNGSNPIATFSGNTNITNSDEVALLTNGNLIV